MLLCSYYVFLFFYLTLLGLVTIKLQICKKKKTKTKNQITIESGNAAQKGRYEWETHARYHPDGKKNAKRKWICNTDLRIKVKLVQVYYGRWHAHNLTEDQVPGHYTLKVLRESAEDRLWHRDTDSVPESNKSVEIRGLKC